jgi:hypothetical protein
MFHSKVLKSIFEPKREVIEESGDIYINSRSWW